MAIDIQREVDVYKTWLGDQMRWLIPSIWQDLETLKKMTVGMSVRACRGETHPKCGQYHSVEWVLRKNMKEKADCAQAFSVPYSQSVKAT